MRPPGYWSDEHELVLSTHRGALHVCSDNAIEAIEQLHDEIRQAHDDGLSLRDITDSIDRFYSHEHVRRIASTTTATKDE